MASAATTAEAPAPAPETEAPAAKPSSALAFAAVMLILTALGVGLGGLTGLQLLGRMEQAASGKTEGRPPQKPGQSAKGRFADGASVRALPPIVTNLASPERTWVRLEAALVVDGEAEATGALAAQITEDIVAYLRTVSLVHIQGASGFQHLREDLNDRVRVRSGGKVRDLVIQSLVVE